MSHSVQTCLQIQALVLLKKMPRLELASCLRFMAVCCFLRWLLSDMPRAFTSRLQMC